MSRLDVFFTSWIMIWFILYYFNIFPYNPKIVLMFAILICSIILCSMLYNNVEKIYIFSFIIIFFLTKLLPYYFVKDSCYTDIDIYFSIFLFVLYLVYLKILFGDTYKFINKIYVKNICYGHKAPIPVQIINNIREYFNPVNNTGLLQK